MLGEHDNPAESRFVFEESQLDGTMMVRQGEKQTAGDIEEEILFHNIPGAESFHPRRVAIGIDNLIYIAGVNSKGVIVLDEDRVGDVFNDGLQKAIAVLGPVV